MREEQKAGTVQQGGLGRLRRRLRNRADSEHEQALIRIGFGLVTLAYCFMLAALSGKDLATTPEILYPIWIAGTGMVLALGGR